MLVLKQRDGLLQRESADITETSKDILQRLYLLRQVLICLMKRKCMVAVEQLLDVSRIYILAIAK
jgi:hypothetical protein